ncbi:glycosyltransferase family 1 protein [Halobacillus kuroshimensis]|uniref:Glycosyltransferase family 1 protein n=1 Tax=Halobacillus kuroshimensis TaxID=302481 RepID=A0ABS3DUX1_9BACI|nr:glycosyltransferase family 1 protein [Halobacillus kuroshimensis]MBN8235141.1 glycosyltransferase family 1 protein [Halobacillus kuroshimensis]
MKKPARILHIVGGMNRGGAETLIMNIYRKIDRSKIQFDFAVSTKEECHFDDEIKALGGRIFYTDNPSISGLNSYKKSLKKILKLHGPFYGVHSHVHHFSGVVLHTAKRMGIPIRLAHSHNTQDGRSSTLKRKVYRWYTRKLIFKYATHLPGCSKAACESLFGNDCWADDRVFVIPNAVDLLPFKNINVDKIELRRKHNLPLKGPLIGHIGRFSEQKNHKFLIEIFDEFLKDNPKASLLLVGNGDLKKDIENLVLDKGIENNIHFLGVRDDVPEILSSLDVLLFPSLYEGLPVVLVEGQAAGVPCVVSDTITKEVDINNGLMNFVNLKSGINSWVREVENSYALEKPSWKNREEFLRYSGYDLDGVVRKMEEIYG